MIEFWVTLSGIVWLDLLLSGDNAIVIALVCRQLPKQQQMMGMIFGAGAAIGLRIIFAIFVSELMSIPGLSIAGAIFLLYVSVKLIMVPDEDDPDGKSSETLLGAIIIIAFADASMSLDNVMAIAALSHGIWLLMSLGVLISIPMVIIGAAIISRLIDRFPIIKYAGAGLLAWVAGGIMMSDRIALRMLGNFDPVIAHYFIASSAVVIVVSAGIIFNKIIDAKPSLD